MLGARNLYLTNFKNSRADDLKSEQSNGEIPRGNMIFEILFLGLKMKMYVSEAERNKHSFRVNKYSACVWQFCLCRSTIGRYSVPHSPGVTQYSQACLHP